MYFECFAKFGKFWSFIGVVFAIDSLKAAKEIQRMQGHKVYGNVYHVCPVLEGGVAEKLDLLLDTDRGNEQYQKLVSRYYRESGAASGWMEEQRSSYRRAEVSAILEMAARISDAKCVDRYIDSRC